MRLSTRTAFIQIKIFFIWKTTVWLQSSRQKFLLLLKKRKNDHGKNLNEKITILMDSQTAILVTQNNMRSSTVLTCMKILNNLRDSDDVTITWTPGHTGIYSNEKAGVLLNLGQHLNV